jgi:two-component system response regulator
MSRPRVVLIVEDDDSQAELALQAFHEPPPWETVWAQDGAEALGILARRGEHAAAPVPDLVLLSIQIPKVRGTVVLKWLRENPDLAGLPVVMWSVCCDENLITQLYRTMGVAAYFSKPYDRGALVEQVRAIRRFWDWAQFPEIPARARQEAPRAPAG